MVEQVLYADSDTFITIEVLKELPFESDAQRSRFLDALYSCYRPPYRIDQTFPVKVVHHALAFCGWNPKKIL